MSKKMPLFAALMAMLSSTPAIAAEQPVVLELFTSQGCSSCPPADALLRQLSANDPSLIPLSLHVDYWNRLGWSDPYSSSLYTDRQNNYAAALGERQVFTPQLIVNGIVSAVGSRENEVKDAIARSKKTPQPFKVAITPDQGGKALDVTVASISAGAAAHLDRVEVLEVHYSAHSQTKVEAGENSGRMLEHINNVTSIKRVGALQTANYHYQIPFADLSGDHVAVILQAENQGPILGAAAY